VAYGTPIALGVLAETETADAAVIATQRLREAIEGLERSLA
jgi:hypothetical protein